ncbi:unnamed protein product, partial [Polarella glacialis]
VKRPPGHDSCCAVIQMINKTEFDGAIGKFDDEDIQVMETFATFVAAKLVRSSLLNQRNRAASFSEASSAFSSTVQPSVLRKKGSSISNMDQAMHRSISEADEEDQEAS